MRRYLHRLLRQARESRLLPALMWQVVEAAPLTVFLIYVSAAQPESPAAWRGPYYSAALLAALVTILRLVRHGLLNRIHLAIGVYFVSGSVALALQWSWMNQFYGRMEATAMLYWVLAVGALTTFASPVGFIGVAGVSLSRTRRASVALLGATVLAALWSRYFHGSALLSAYVPFVAVFLAQSVLRGRCVGGSADAPRLPANLSGKQENKHAPHAAG